MDKVMITGGTGTIGSLVIKKFVNLGYDVYFQYHDNVKFAKKLMREYGVKGIQISAEQMIEKKDFSGVPKDCKILINCIGKHIVVQEAESVKVEEIDCLFKTNVEVPFLFIKYFLPYMKQIGCGYIINISSVCGLRIGENNIPYILSKHALSALTKCIAEEYGQYGIRCNEICPSAIKSNMNDEILKKESELYGYGLQEYIFLEGGKEPLDPEVIVDSIIFLISDKASGINGYSLVIDND